MSRVFVLGSTGFIGQALMIKLYEQGFKFASVGIRNSDVYLELGKEHSNLLTAVESGDIVIFLAAISSPDFCKNQLQHARMVNVTATSSLIENLTDKGVRVIFSSTDLVFGLCTGVVVDNSIVAPFGEYGMMKADVESSFLKNPLVKVVRFSYVMGPGDKYTQMLLGANQSSQSVEVFDGFERNVVALSDVTDGICNLIRYWDTISNRVINFSGPECVSRWQLTLAFSRQFCPTLNCTLTDAPNGFWSARPKRIEMTSSVFSELLLRTPKSVCENLLTWCN
ncbi:MAG: SDR family oxidoreductase [Shewanella sp.]|uniref:NAD-dependent epimerase/dehydratase family protein n=1 Tax=Shewanella sp. TaxID=50422 RepID=UPI00356578F3